MSTGETVGADLLATIVAATRRTVEFREARESLSTLETRALARPARGRGFLAALQGTDGRPQPRVIAECKRRSPSRGVLRQDYDAVAIAGGYERAGAAAISVLTESTFFDGALDHLAAVRAAVDIPILRKDFIVSDYQLLEARAVGADAVLLIVAALSPSELAGLHATATSLGLDSLVEVHNEPELAIAIESGATIIGVNNRNLRTLEVDVKASERLIARMPREVVAVSESGLKTPEDLVRLGALGYHAFLMGERFMTKVDPGGELGTLLTAVRAQSGSHAG